MDDTLTTLSLEQMRMVTQLSRKSLRALEKSGRRNVPGRDHEVSGVDLSARLCAICQHSSKVKVIREVVMTQTTKTPVVLHQSAERCFWLPLVLHWVGGDRVLNGPAFVRTMCHPADMSEQPCGMRQWHLKAERRLADPRSLLTTPLAVVV